MSYHIEAYYAHKNVWYVLERDFPTKKAAVGRYRELRGIRNNFHEQPRLRVIKTQKQE